MHASETALKGWSRRGFMKGALAAGTAGIALSMSDRMAMATQMITGGRPSIEAIRGVGVQPGLVRMSLNENPLGPSPRSIEAMANRMFGVNRYGTDLRDLMQALSTFDGVELPEPDESMRRSFFRPPPSPFMLTPGSSLILDLLCLAYLSRNGGEVIEAEFGYGSISRSASDYNANFGVDVNIIRAPMTPEYKHDLDGMAALASDRTSLVVITNPNNPTGTLLQTDEIEAFINKLPSSAIVVIDEAYLHFVEQDPIPSAVPLAVKYDNVAVVRTFSKAYALAAVRLGYCVASQKIQDEMRKYYQESPNALATVAGAAAVRDLEHLQKSREAVWDFKKRCYAAFDEMGIEYLPSQGTFVMADIKRPAMQVVREMRARNVWISSRRQREFRDWIRVSAGTEAETEVFLQTLKDVLAKSS
ncbi:MAG: aminotransferase class I/II-fold pyridoxal phosphate-dependent enzyme [Gemmatimonadetes bacterium]|nr:aminotransferase class I/II-fold pyridoxal phosphate-dependent enzyme [Gemmatimonadota bacterium]MYG17307.1 aminotransferase class I/II-fold pyridoxal phosphate-dependent enzyme [Gemmatimonadota bacterium]